MHTLFSRSLRRVALLAGIVTVSHSAAAQGSATASACAAVAGPAISTARDTAAIQSRLPTARDTATSQSNLRPPRDTARAAVRLFASVSADEVTFRKEPKICVTLTGDARLDSVRVVGRRNLPSPVVSGTSYRNVYVAVEILGHLNAECIAARITRSAAGGSGGPCASLQVRDTTAVRAPAGVRPVPPRESPIIHEHAGPARR